jgi:nicotinate-nucleotide pyrophosphorylase (carboxylating)
MLMIEPSGYHFLIRKALAEDLADRGDVTTDAIFSGRRGTGYLVSKGKGVLAGCPVVTRVFQEIDPEIKVEFFLSDGDRLHPGDTVAEVAGRVKAILTAERTALNFLSYISGIATATGEFVESAHAGGRAVILDTRKTLPGYRGLAKYGVRVGGGKNHRMGLYDMVMIKDNHIDAAGSITKAVEKIRAAYGTAYTVEVECRTLGDLREALELGVDIAMLDNMDLDSVSAAVSLRRELGKEEILLEVSGNMDLKKTREMSGAGVDYISVGSLTHSVQAFDFSLKLGGGQYGG